MTMHNDINTSPGATTGGGARTTSAPATSTNVGIFAGMINPRDRIHWGAVWGGLFASLATLFVLGVFGTAIGLSIYDRGDAREVGWGLGIWMIISAIIAFFVGGWLAGRSAAIVGSRNGLLNGMMVWALALGLLLLLSGTSLTNLVGVNLSANSIGGNQSAGQNLQMDLPLDNAQPAGAQLNGQNQQGQADSTGPLISESAAGNAATAAWWTLVALLVGLGCAAAGGWVGVSKFDRDDADRTDYDRRTATA